MWTKIHCDSIPTAKQNPLPTDHEYKDATPSLLAQPMQINLLTAVMSIEDSGIMNSPVDSDVQTLALCCPNQRINALIKSICITQVFSYW
jgi:hypothetical protein